MNHIILQILFVSLIVNEGKFHYGYLDGQNNTIVQRKKYKVEERIKNNDYDTVLNNQEITKDKALKIAKEEAVKIGYDTSNKSLGIVERSTTLDSMKATIINMIRSGDSVLNENLFKKWKEYTLGGNNDKRLKKLLGKRFWIVSFNPIRKAKDILFGGNLTLFIDVSSGEVLIVSKGY